MFHITLTPISISKVFSPGERLVTDWFSLKRRQFISVFLNEDVNYLFWKQSLKLRGGQRITTVNNITTRYYQSINIHSRSIIVWFTS